MHATPSDAKINHERYYSMMHPVQDHPYAPIHVNRTKLLTLCSKFLGSKYDPSALGVTNLYKYFHKCSCFTRVARPVWLKNGLA